MGYGSSPYGKSYGDPKRLRDPKRDLRWFLRQNLETDLLSFPFNADEQVDIADFDGGIEAPSIMIQAMNKTVPGGGTTGYTGIDGSGAGPTQDIQVSIQVDCWGGNIRSGAVREYGITPDEIATELGELVSKAGRDNSRNLSNYRLISIPETQQNNDDRSNPTEYRQTTFARLFYHASPE